MTEEWQFIGDDSWIFGEKVRGVVRYPRAEVYFDNDYEGREGGWVWFLIGSPTRGREGSLGLAIAAAEKALGIG